MTLGNNFTEIKADKEKTLPNLLGFQLCHGKARIKEKNNMLIAKETNYRRFSGKQLIEKLKADKPNIRLSKTFYSMDMCHLFLTLELK